jgi:phage terminase Nu1 subunit (DNA packaging protein)
MPDTPSADVLTVEQVEQSGEWVRGTGSPYGLSHAAISYWRDRGCPYLPGRKKLEFRVEWVIVPGRPGAWPVHFYSRAELEHVGALFRNRHVVPPPYSLRGKTDGAARAQRARWDAAQQVERDGKVWLSALAARELLGVSGPTLQRWSRKSCPFLDDRCLTCRWEQVAGSAVRYYDPAELAAVREKKAQLPADVTGPGLLSLEQAAGRLGLAARQLRYRAVREALGLRALGMAVRTADRGPRRRLAFDEADVAHLLAGANRYIAGTLARRMLDVDASKLWRLCRAGRLRHRRPGGDPHRLEVHLGDLLRHLQERR